jgi:hypothetical protein
MERIVQDILATKVIPATLYSIHVTNELKAEANNLVVDTKASVLNLKKTTGKVISSMKLESEDQSLMGQFLLRNFLFRV